MSLPDDRRDDFPPEDSAWPEYRRAGDYGDLDGARGLAIAVVIGLASLLLAVVITCSFGFCGK